MSALFDGALRAEYLLDDPDLVHAEAIATLPPLDEQRRANIRALARSGDSMVDGLRSIIRGNVA